MVAPCRTALSILGGGGGSDGPPGNEVGGRQTAHQPCLALALHSLCAAGQEGRPSSMWAHQHPHREGLKAPPASAKQISYYHMVQGGWVFRKVFCSIRLPFLILSLGAVFPLSLSMDSGSRLLQLPIWETPKAKQKQGTQRILVHLPELLGSPSSTCPSECTQAFVALYPRVF